MKALKALALSLALLIPTASFASHKVEACVAQSNLVVVLAMVREYDGHPEAVFNTLIQGGIEEEVAMALLTLVFHTMKNVAAIDMGMLVFNACIGEDA